MANVNCPECSTEYVKRVRRESLKERLLSLFYVYPFRCQLCGYRFKYLQWGVKYLRVEDDRRIDERFRVNFPVTFRSESIESKGSVTDVSMAGCAMQTKAKLDPGAILSMSLQISDSMPPVGVQAAVVRDVGESRAGVEFLQLRRAERDRLRDFISALLPAARKG